MRVSFVDRMGLVCLGLALGCLGLAIPLGCFKLALEMGSFTLLDGALFGALLALVTRTPRPGLIYLSLLMAALTFWPLCVAWPPAYPEDVHLWPGAPSLLGNYFDFSRAVLFLLAAPYPFARLGHHAADALPPGPGIREK